MVGTGLWPAYNAPPRKEYRRKPKIYAVHGISSGTVKTLCGLKISKVKFIAGWWRMITCENCKRVLKSRK